MVFIPKRTELVKCTGMISSYRDKKGNRLPIEKLGIGSLIHPEMFEALKKLEELINEDGGSLFITDLFRDYKLQKYLREKYEKGIQKAFASKPGESFHGGGCAIDLDVQNLNFPKVLKKDWIKHLWYLAIPLGFRPVIEKAEFISECWHLDYIPSYLKDNKTIFKYVDAARCVNLDCGNWDTEEQSQNKIYNLFIQSQLMRLDFNIGSIDGIVGNKTKNAVISLHIGDNPSIENIVAYLKNKV